MKRAVGVVGRALITQARVRLAGNVLGESCRQAGFADARLARDQHDLPLAFPGEALAVHQKFDLVLAADEIGQTGAADCLETALGSRHALDRPCRNRLGNALDVMAAEVAQTEQVAEQTARSGGDDHRPRPSQGLKTGGKVRRLPDQSVLPQRTFSAEVADHDQAGCNTNADRKRFHSVRLEPRNGGSDIERRPHGALGIVFVRAGIAEIGQYPVAPKIAEEAIIGLHDTGAGGMIGIHHSAHLLGIEPPQ